ncbi:hypothetical protein L6452_35987 [Arctium lappa]|uniref:Uncharacterized protein n=1 Tax=Arctium lappa TaxID=4217 RepID=A0ACB8Y9F7_ARCLA|nr:hypothetical protein L6452_35987 [Arctium lappa]
MLKIYNSTCTATYAATYEENCWCIVVEKRNSNNVVKQVDPVGIEVFVGDRNKKATEAEAMIFDGSHNQEDQNDICRNDVEGILTLTINAGKDDQFNSEDSSLHPLEESCVSLSANPTIAENQYDISVTRNLVPEINSDAPDFYHSSEGSGQKDERLWLYIEILCPESADRRKVAHQDFVE